MERKMKVAVRYYTRGGNTKKLADAISKALGVPAQTTSVPLPILLRKSFHRVLIQTTD